MAEDLLQQPAIKESLQEIMSVLKAEAVERQEARTLSRIRTDTTKDDTTVTGVGGEPHADQGNGGEPRRWRA